MTGETDFRRLQWCGGTPRWPDTAQTLHGTLWDALSGAAEASGGADDITVLPNREQGSPLQLSYVEFERRVRRTAVGLRELGVAPGDRVMLALPNGIEFIEAFFASHVVGVIPCSAAPPEPQRLQSALSRLHYVARDSGAVACITTESIRAAIRPIADGAPALRHFVTVQELTQLALTDEVQPDVDPESIALLQYTSGSTSHPKGVILTHRNLVTNVHAMGQAFAVRDGDRMCSWCPLSHDMGLFAGVLLPIYWQLPLVLMSPRAFMSKPWRWVRAISDYRCSISPAPNVGYELAVRKASPDRLDGLDLSSWRAALNGSEYVRLSTVEAFQEKYEPYGLPVTAMMPCYGLAEATVGVCYHPSGTPIISEALDRNRLGQGEAVIRDGTVPHTAHVISVGPIAPSHALRVVDDDGNDLPERRVGNILVAGGSVSRGYFGNPTETEQTIREGWLWTGDLGYLVDGNLFLTGRAKDIIIIHGRNYYPTDIERSAEMVPGVRGGGCAAFGVYDENKGRELVVVMCETALQEASEKAQLREEVAQKIGANVGIRADDIVFVQPRAIPKTTSGKTQRAACRAMYISNTFASDLETGDREYRLYPYL